MNLYFLQYRYMGASFENPMSRLFRTFSTGISDHFAALDVNLQNLAADALKEAIIAAAGTLAPVAGFDVAVARDYNSSEGTLLRLEAASRSKRKVYTITPEHAGEVYTLVEVQLAAHAGKDFPIVFWEDKRWMCLGRTKEPAGFVLMDVEIKLADPFETRGSLI